jgi:hypothetical protein
MNFPKVATITAALLVGSLSAGAAQLSADAKAAIPHDVQQLIAIDYRAMENSPTAMSMKDRLMQPELRTFETALTRSGLNVSRDVDVLVFAAFRSHSNGDNGSSASTKDTTRTIGIAQGQFGTQAIQAYFTKQKIKPVMVRNTPVYAMGSAGLSVVFLNQTTMVFGEKSAVNAALDARDGLQPSLLTNNDLMDSMNSVDNEAIWSLLDAKGSQVVLKSLLGDASGLADFKTVQDHLQGARYTMDFNNGIRFKMEVITGDPITAAAMSTLLQGAVLYKKTSGTDAEKEALNDTTVNSTGDILTAQYQASDSQFSNLLSSNLFQSVVR